MIVPYDIKGFHVVGTGLEPATLGSSDRSSTIGATPPVTSSRDHVLLQHREPTSTGHRPLHEL